MAIDPSRPAPIAQERIGTPGRLRSASRLWSGEVWPTLRLAAPIMVSRAGITLMFVVDSILVGQTRGIELAYLGQAVAAQGVLMLIGIGLMQGSMILSAQAFGAQDFGECGRVLKTAWCVGALIGVILACLSLFLERFLLVTGTDAELAHQAGRVSWQFAWGMPGMLLFIASNYFLESVKRPYFGVAIMAVCNVVNLFGVGVLVAGWFGWFPRGGAEMAVLTTSGVRWLAFLLAFAAILSLDDARKFGIFGAIGPIWPRTRKLFRLGGPIALMLGMDQAAFAAIVVMAGHLGATVAAAQQATTNLNGIFFMLIVGLSAATNIRVGHAVGASDAVEAARAGWTGIGIAAGFTALVAFTFLFTPEILARIYTHDPEVLGIAVGAIMSAAVLIVFDGTLTVTSGALRGRGDTLTPALFHMACLWIVGVPAAYGIAFKSGFGAPGLFLGLSTGMAISCGILLFRHWRLAKGEVRRL